MKYVNEKNVTIALVWVTTTSLVTMLIGCVGYYGFGITDGVIATIGQFGSFLAVGTVFFMWGQYIQERMVRCY